MSAKIKKIVMANGVFDMLHIGHLRHLEAARAMGDILWVSITDDQHVRKGPGRPIYTDTDRHALIKALRCVDKAIIVSGLIEALEIIRPHILVKGIDYKDGLHDVHEKYCREHCIEIRYTDTPKLSATEFIYEAKRAAKY